MKEKIAEQKMRKDSLSKFTPNLKSFIARLSNIIAHNLLLICNFLKYFSASFNMIFSGNLGNNLILV